MFKIITPEKRAKYKGLLKDLHQFRQRTSYVDLDRNPLANETFSGADGPDNDETTYVTVSNVQGQVVGFACLNPTLGVCRIYPKQCDSELAGAHIWECSRITIDPRITHPREVAELLCRLTLGITIFCLERAVCPLVWVVDKDCWIHLEGLFQMECLASIPYRENKEDLFAGVRASIFKRWICILSASEEGLLALEDRWPLKREERGRSTRRD